MANNIKNPPSFDPETDDFVSWKNDLSVWKMFSDYQKKKIGPAVYLSLKGKAREAVRTMDVTKLNEDAGYDTLITKLDGIYLTDDSSLAFTAFQEFYEYRREAGHNFSQFIVEFEKRYFKVKCSVIKELPDGVLAFFLLKAANLTTESEKLARATANLELKDMKDKIMKIFGDPGVLNDSEMTPEVKEEALYGSSYERGRGRFRGGYRGGFRGGYRNANDTMPPSPSPNRGVRSLQCYECGSNSHFVRECPRRQNRGNPSQQQQYPSQQKAYDVHITLVCAKPKSGLLLESFGKGVLDSGCSKTFAGRIWYDEYISTLPGNERRLVLEKSSSSVFRFGDGAESKSSMLVTIPVVIAA